MARRGSFIYFVTECGCFRVDNFVFIVRPLTMYLFINIAYHVSNVEKNRRINDLKRCVRSMCRQCHSPLSSLAIMRVFNQLRRIKLIEQRQTHTHTLTHSGLSSTTPMTTINENIYFDFSLTVLFLTILIEVLFDHEQKKSCTKLNHSWFLALALKHFIYIQSDSIATDGD